jgi:Fe-S-cluster-containing hydrogenase component 2
LLACKWDCIHRLPSGEIEIDEVQCKGCGQCISKCPWGNILLVEEKGSSSTAKRRKAVMCDMCRGLPYALCTYNCPQRAAQRGDPRVLFPKVFEAIEL